MGCCQYPPVGEGCGGAFTVDTSRVTFGRGCLAEVGERARALGMKRVARFSDARVARLPFFATVRQSLRAAGLDVVVYTGVQALRLMGLYLERAVRDAGDVEAREQTMWAATLAGIAFGNAVVAPRGDRRGGGSRGWC